MVKKTKTFLNQIYLLIGVSCVFWGCSSQVEQDELYSEIIGNWYVCSAQISIYPYLYGAFPAIKDTQFPDYIITVDSLYCFDYYSKENEPVLIYSGKYILRNNVLTVAGRKISITKDPIGCFYLSQPVNDTNFLVEHLINYEKCDYDR